MDFYQEQKQARHDYFLDEMIDCKERALKKFKIISGDADVLEKFARMLIDADSEDCEGANFFLYQFFEVTDTERAAILEDLEIFTELLIEEREEEYISTIYEE